MGLDKDILIVPVGDVLNSLDKRMRAGDVLGFGSGVDFYRDDVHFKEGVGYLQSAPPSTRRSTTTTQWDWQFLPR